MSKNGFLKFCPHIITYNLLIFNINWQSIENQYFFKYTHTQCFANRQVELILIRTDLLSNLSKL